MERNGHDQTRVKTTAKHKNLRVTGHQARDLKPGTSEHKAGLLPTTQLCISTQQWGYISTTAINAHIAKARNSYNTKFALLSYE